MPSEEAAVVAWHESGHAAVGMLVGYEPGPVSIVPRRRWGGVVRIGEALDEAEMVWAPMLPLPLKPAGFRRKLELSILVDMAGPAAESLAPRERDPGYLPTPLIERLDEIIAEAPLSSADRLFLADGDSDKPPAITDLQRAYAAAELLAGDRADQLVKLLAAEAVAIVRWPPVRIAIDRLSRALLQERELAGGAITAILNLKPIEVSA